jgi:hypothetical protein
VSLSAHRQADTVSENSCIDLLQGPPVKIKETNYQYAKAIVPATNTPFPIDGHLRQCLMS